ncbi:MAG: hypothetical protein WD991_00625 [Candidatus Paceibacterota bacterium]
MQKIKHFLDSEQSKDILTVIIIILVGLGSFGLGRLSKQPPKEGLKIEYRGVELSGNTLEALNASNIVENVGGKNFFASSRGTKYYPVGCQAGTSLKQENRIYFTTREAAEGAGYELSSSCR